MTWGTVPLKKDKETRPRTREQVWVERGFCASLAVLFAYLAYYSSCKLLWFDEFLSYYTERTRSAAELLRIQAATPVSLDPPLYHLLGHWLLGLGWNPALAVRFPALLGSMAMAAGIYIYTRRIAGFYAAAISVAGLLLTYEFYLVEARPYGILLGATAGALVLWQNAIRGIYRPLSVAGLFLVLGLAVSCHYFGILVALPILLAELWRTWRDRRLDLPVVAAALLSYGFALFWLPYLNGAKPYKTHYYVSGKFLDAIRSYSWLEEIHRSVKGLSAVADTLIFVVLVGTVVAGAYLGYRAGLGRASEQSSEDGKPASLPEEWWALVFVAILPVFGGALAVVGAGSYLARYVLESSIGLMVPRVSGILTLVRSVRIKQLVLAVCLVLMVAALVRDHKRDRKGREQLQFSQAQSGPGVLVIPDQYDDYMRLHFDDAPDGSTAEQFPFVADMARELAWKGTDNLSRTMLNMRQFTGLPVMSYDDLLREGRPVVLIESKANRHAWLLDQLRQDHAQIRLKATEGDHSSYDVLLPGAGRP